MIKEIYGKKIGMTQLFDDEGNLLPTTLVEVEPVCVLEILKYPTQKKAKIGCFKIEEKKIGKVKQPIKGYFDKLGVSAYKLIREVNIEEGADFSKEQSPKEDIKDVSTKSVSKDNKAKDPVNFRQIGVEIFKIGERVDAQAKSKGKGFTGGMKRHGWSGQPSSHGHTMHRRLGSAGASAYPSKIIKGLGMPGHMGNSFCTAKNLMVLKVDKDKSLVFLRGNVPGARGAIVRLRKINSIKKNSSAL